ncbi:hypothetical protein BDV93DRAFT_512210 [Ceratobasidium sp. AG-I]|nr:hypothetical protein BDV93DRAFT_512210 [Ceratobasidium sp. AG-I]
MADNQTNQTPDHYHTPEFHTPPPPSGEPPLTGATTTQRPDEHATQQAATLTQPPASSVPTTAQAPASELPAQPSANPFDDGQRTAAPAQPGQLAEPPQHPDRPLPLGGVTETPLHSEPAPYLPPRPQPEPQVQPESQISPPPRASFDQPIPDHPAMRQSSTGRSYSPTPMQRVALTPVAPQPIPPQPQAPVLDANADTLESDPAIASLHAMFPSFDLMVIQSILEATGGDKDQAVDSLLSMSDPDYTPSHQQAAPGGGAPNQTRPPTQTELDEEFARRLMLEEEEQARGGAWPPNEQQNNPYSQSVPYQQYQSRRSGEYQRPSGEYQRPAGTGQGAGGGIGEIAGDLQQQFRSFIGGAGGSGRRTAGTQGQGQVQGQGAGGAGYQDQFNKIADTGKKTLNSIFNKVKQKMEEFDGRNPSDTQNMNQPPQSGHWSNWQGPPAQGSTHNQTQQQQQVPTYASSPAPAQQYAPPSHPPPSTAQHGALNNNPYAIPEGPPAQTGANANTAALPASSGRWHYQPEESSAPAAAAPALAPSATAATGAEEPRRSIDATRLGLLPKRPVSLMDVNANTRQAQPPATTHERDSDEECESCAHIWNVEL